MPGHLFVLRGNLMRLACDAVILPCDDRLNITRVWADLLPAELPQGDWSDWLRLPRSSVEGDVVVLDDVASRRVRAVITTVTQAVAHPDAPRDVARRLAAGVRAAARGLQTHDGRHVPLIGVPLAGTGSGGLEHRRAEVIEALLPELRAAANGVDIALVLWDPRDLAAVQNLRTDDADWSELDDPLRVRADHLGALAAQGRLSLFIGAGVSRPAGLPDWWTLLKELAQEAQITDIDWSTARDPLEIATPIVDKLGNRFHDTVRNRLSTEKYALGHSLLAGLRVQQMVTTNFDACMELAMEDAFDGEYRVLTRRLADSSLPWLLKLHGDVNRPNSLVLSGAHYEEHAREYAALRGVVQSIMLTSHLLFVGFSLTDQNFLGMAAAVARVRQDAEAEEGRPLPPAGTALALTRDDLKDKASLPEQLTFVCMTDAGTSFEAAARTLDPPRPPGLDRRAKPSAIGRVPLGRTLRERAQRPRPHAAKLTEETTKRVAARRPSQRRVAPDRGCTQEPRGVTSPSMAARLLDW